MKQLLLFLLMASPVFLFGQGGADCSTMEPICTDVGLNFTANSGVAEASTTDPGNDYGCLITQPNPSWYFLEISSSGDVDMHLYAADDIDFIVWGPFTSLSDAQANCGDMGNPPGNNEVDCSFSSTNDEFPSIPGAVIGEVYVMLITNYADVVQNITLEQVGGTGATDCSIVTNPPCAMTQFDVNVSGCNFTTGLYDISGTIYYDDPPTSGDLVVVDCNLNSVIVDSWPFAASPQNFNLNGLNSDGLACDVTAYFTADPVCTQTFNYTAPVCLTDCPTYDLNSISPTETCGNQTYVLEILNSGCDGYVEFDVVGNYGSSFASDITWQVTSNTTTNVVASGGPGTDGANFSVSTGQLDPAVEGYIYTLQIADAWGDGFNGAGGYITVQQGGSDIITPITGNFGSGRTIMFQAGLVVSTSTLSVTTPSGIVTSTIGNCQDHEVSFTLDNTNYCTPIQVDLPWVITCDNTGDQIASGTHTVTVYPQVPTNSTDVVAITWNAGTCTWDVSPNNDCSALDLGTLFTITPDPTTIPNYCASGNENFTVDYLGFASGPNCCSTAGPSVPITYSSSTVITDAVLTDSPFGGVNNTALVTIPANNDGGNATSLTLDVDLSGVCVNPVGIGSEDFWVTIYVDGWIIEDFMVSAPTSTYSNTFNIGDLPYGYNENSVIEVFVYPNGLSNVWDSNDPCPVNNGEWNLSSLNTTLSVTFEQQTATPVSCALADTPPYTCCVITPLSADPPGPVTVSCSADVPAVNTASVTNIVSDCATTVTHQGDVSDGLSCPETITRTYRVTDDCGNFIDVTQAITVHDLINPVMAAAPAPVTVDCIGNLPVMVNVGWTDNCDGAGSIVGTDGALVGGPCGGTVTRTWTYTDACGNSASVSQIITVNDNIDPVLAAAPADITVDCIGNIPAMTNLGWTDNCDGAGSVAGADGALVGGSCGGTITRTWTYTDACGNTATTTQTITVDDNIAPVFAAAPADVTVECIGDVPAMTNLGWTDNCDGAGSVAGVDGALVGGSCGGTITRTWTYTDACGNIGNAIQTITVDDNTNPVFAAAPIDVTVECIGDVPAMTNLGWTDNCDGAGSVAGIDGALVGGSCGGTITRTWTYTDACGNIGTATQTITVDDNTNPVFAAAPIDVTVECIGDVPAMSNLGWTDNCDGAGSVAGVDGALVGGSCGGTITRTWTYTDACGNVGTATQIITVDDNTLPVMAAAPADVTVDCIGNLPAMVNVGWTDNCDGAGSVAGVDGALVGGSCGGTVTRTWTYTDACGNTASVSQIITVDDNIAPVFAAAPADVTVDCIGNVPAMTNLGWTDNCDGAGSVAGIDGALIGGDCGGTITRTWSYTDACGNLATATQTITVDDNTNPTASNPAGISVPGGPAPAPDIMVVTDEADNCTVAPVVAWVSDATDGGFCPEIITRTYSVTDDCGNSINVTQTITIGDAIIPTASDPAGINVECIADVPLKDENVVIDEADNGGPPTVAWEDDTSDGLSCPETITRRYRVTDDCGNFIFVQQLITVLDVTVPVMAAAPVDITVECIGDVPAMTDLGWTDNCDGAGLVTGVDGALIGGSCGGTITRTWTYTDACGNVGTATQTITVDDNTNPVFAAAPIDVTVECIGDVPAMTNLGWTDNCDGAGSVAGVDGALIGGSCGGTITRTWTYTDACGNIGTATQTITVDDNTNPVFAAAPIDVTVECIGDVPAMTNLGWTDNCDGAGSVAGIDGALVGGSCGGTITRTWTYTDACGNIGTATQTITVDDNTNPVFAAAPIDVTVECIGDVPAMTNLGWTDNCDGAGSVAGIDGALVGGSCGGTITRTWTYTDACGNIGTATQTITVDDNTIPVFAAAPIDVTVECIGDVPAMTNLGWTDNCDGAGSVAGVDGALVGGTCGGTITRTWTYTDACGNVGTTTQTITVDDNTNPVFAAAPVDVTVECIGDVPAMTDLGWTDNCDGLGTVTGVDGALVGGTCGGTITRTWTYTDACGNVGTTSQIITVDDNTAPVMAAAPLDVTVECVGDVPAMTDLGWTDNCDGAGIVTGIDGAIVGGTCGGTITRTWTYTDACGNSASVSQIITVDDNTAPVMAAAPANVTIECIGDLPAMTDVAWTDNCDGAGTISGSDGPVIGGTCGGSITRTWTYTDACGNSASVTQEINIDDSTPPVFNPAPSDITVECIGNVPAMTDLDWTDNCDGFGAVTGVDSPLAGGTCGGSITRTWTYTDGCGNISVATQIINVDDSTPPTGSDLTPIPVECAADVPAPDPLVVTDEADNCTVAPVVAWVDDVSDNGTCPEVITRTYRITDDCGNNFDVYQTITIMDITAPTASNPAQINAQCSGNIPAPDESVVTDEADNCGIPTVAFVDDVSDGNTCPETITRTYSVTDACDNSINVIQLIIVHDDIDPTASNPGNISVECIEDVPAPDVSVVTDEADNCSSPSVEWVSDVSDGGTCPEIITRTYMILDDCGNAATVEQLIIVNDITNPTASDPVAITVGPGESVPAPDVSVITDEEDNCSTPIVTYIGETTDGGKCPETIVRTYRIMDACDNYIDVTQTITVNIACEVVIPSAFTPDADQTNDTWEIVNIDLIYPNNRVFIYNRWGNLLFESEQGKYSNNLWDGKMSGELLPVGSYYYMIYTEGDNSGEILKGTVSIILN